jgi:hypothetical protein
MPWRNGGLDWGRRKGTTIISPTLPQSTLGGSPFDRLVPGTVSVADLRSGAFYDPWFRIRDKWVPDLGSVIQTPYF